MCGFVGIIGLNGAPASEATAQQLADALAHRGPDASGGASVPGVAMAFRRLSILDLSPAGDQPRLNEDGTIALVFNGEIFNYVELREELRARGHRFRSTGDTEVLLRAYEEWGPDCLSRLNGMWAFLLYDGRRKVIFGSRDRFGVKPLYRRRIGDRVYFASEIKALVAEPLPPADPNWSRAAHFLGSGRLDDQPDGEETFYDGVTQLLPAHAFELRLDGTERRWRWWNLPAEGEGAPSDPVAAVRELVEDSVRLRLRSDVPVGVALSGGMDSTSILCTMARVRTEGADAGELPALRAYSFMPPEFDESTYVHATIERSGAELHRVPLDVEVMRENLPRMLAFQDEPVHSAPAVVSYEIYRMAAAHGVRVLLCGQGADEVMGGYRSFFQPAWYTHLRRGQLALLVAGVRDYCASRDLPVAPVLRQLLWSTAVGVANHSAAYRRLRRRGRAPAFARWLAPEFLARAPQPADGPPDDRTLNAELARAVEQMPLPLYLRIEDRNSMAHSVEARLPFLDYRLVNLCFSLPPEWKLRGRWNKYALRQAMEGTLPEVVRQRVDKMGFRTPAANWFRGVLGDLLQAHLAEPGLRQQGIFDVGRVQQALDGHRRGEPGHTTLLFNVLQFAIWLQLVQQRRTRTARLTA